VPVTFDPDSDPIVMRASGSLAVRDSIEAMDQIVAHTGGAAIHRNVLFMLDVTVSLHQLDVNGHQELAKAVEGWAARYPGRNVRTAIVVPDTISQANAKLWRGLTETNPKIGSEVGIFSTEAAARSWLSEPLA
jgi:hypothetical protein